MSDDFLAAYTAQIDALRMARDLIAARIAQGMTEHEARESLRGLVDVDAVPRLGSDRSA